MAELNKKMHIKNSSGVKQDVKIYSTVEESGNQYLPIKIDNIQAYICLCAIEDTRATYGRVRKNNNVLAIGINGIPAYSYNLLTINGSFTVPTGISKLRVTCVGGGAGGLIDRDCQGFTSVGQYTYTASGVQGNPTSFGNVTANGATSSVYSAYIFVSDDGEGNISSECRSRSVTNSYGTQNGSSAQNGSNVSHGYSGAPSVSLTKIDGTSAGSAGAGGGVVAGQGAQVCTGGSGYKVTAIINVSPGQVISYTIGSGGRCLHTGNLYTTAHNDGYRGICYPGSAGAILVEWGQGIQ